MHAGIAMAAVSSRRSDSTVALDYEDGGSHMDKYEGMRWFKCDFQVQTPEDSGNWNDSDTRLPEPRRPLRAPDGGGPPTFDESIIQDAARKFLRRCHELQLEVVGITDHNFSNKSEPRDWFCTHLVEQNRAVARELGRAPLHIFVGFEVDIGYHVLCLFNPAKKLLHLRRVHMILTRLGLGENQRFKSGRPEPLRLAGESVSLKKLLEIVQGEHDGICVAAHADQNDGILSQARNIQDYHLLDLYAVELTSNPPSQRYADILDGRNSEWSRRLRQPAWIMSSDAKSLASRDDGTCPPNCLGYRHTWLRMSSPSTASMRQAFLDPKSRVRIGGSHPAEFTTHPRINTIQVQGAKFLADRIYYLSEHLNCVIGGRGSGKSSLLEYLRFALEPDARERPSADEPGERKRALILASLAETNGTVRIEFQSAPGVTDTLIYEPGNRSSPRRIEGRTVADLATVLRQVQAQFFSQGELSRLTGQGGGQEQVRAILDSAGGAPLVSLQSDERELKDALENLFQAARNQVRIEADLRIATQEMTEVARQLAASKAVQSHAGRSHAAAAVSRRLEELVSARDLEESSIQRVVQDMSTPLSPDTADVIDFPEGASLSQAVQAFNAERTHFAQAIRDASLRLIERFEQLFGEAATASLQVKIQEAQERFRDACKENGIKEEDILRLEELAERRLQREKEILDLQKRLAELKKTTAAFTPTLGKLHANWANQFSLRRSTADTMQTAVTSQALRIQTIYMGDEQAFMEQWQRLSPRDGRGKLAKRWVELGLDIHKAWLERGDLPSPWELVEACRTDPRAIPYLYGQYGEDLQPLLIHHLDGSDVQGVWEAVRMSRIFDKVDVELRRDDGSVAGAMSGTLSEGQRNTVLLNLMLARGSGPIIIDQPEDELDSNFIYKTLVKDLRATKEKRQLIVATHNANLPVNADAELICALEAREGRGTPIAVGGLDQDAVSRAVLEIMEGSEEAFRRRSEKYNF